MEFLRSGYRIAKFDRLQGNFLLFRFRNVYGKPTSEQARAGWPTFSPFALYATTNESAAPLRLSPRLRSGLRLKTGQALCGFQRVGTTNPANLFLVLEDLISTTCDTHPSQRTRRIGHRRTPPIFFAPLNTGEAADTSIAVRHRGANPNLFASDMTNFWYALVPLSSVLVVAFAGAMHRPLATLPSVDLKRYVGTWYEIARYPNAFRRIARPTRQQTTLCSRTPPFKSLIRAGGRMAA